MHKTSYDILTPIKSIAINSSDFELYERASLCPKLNHASGGKVIFLTTFPLSYKIIICEKLHPTESNLSVGA